MSLGAAGLFFGFLVRTVGPQAPQQESLPPDMSISLITSEPKCAWLDRLALPVSDILDTPASPPLPIPYSNPLQCLRAEQFNFLDWNASPPPAVNLPSQPQTSWLDRLAALDYCDTAQPIAGHVASFNVFTLVAGFVALVALFKIGRWAWRLRETLAPYLLAATIYVTYEAVLATVPVYTMYHCGVLSIPYICLITPWLFGKALLLRQPITRSEYQRLLDQVKSLTESLDALNNAKEAGEEEYSKAATTSSTKIAELEGQVSQERATVTSLAAEKEKALQDVEMLTARGNSLTTTNEQLTEDVDGLRNGVESTARSHLETLERHTSEVAELNAALLAASEQRRKLTNDVEAKDAQIEALDTRITTMQHGIDIDTGAQAKAMAQLSDTANGLALEKESLAPEVLAVRAEKAELEERLTAVVEEKMQLTEDASARASEVATLQVSLSTEQARTEKVVEQGRIQEEELIELRSAVASLREELAAVNANAVLKQEETPQHCAQTWSITEAQMLQSTGLLPDASDSWTRTEAMVDHVTTEIDITVTANPRSEDLSRGVVLKVLDLNGMRLIENTTKDFPYQDTPLGQKGNEQLATIPATMPMSPPVTPPGNPAQLFESTTTTLGLDSMTTLVDCTTPEAPQEPKASTDIPTPNPLDAPSTPVLILDLPATAQPTITESSQGEPTPRSNVKGPRSVFGAAWKATKTPESEAASSKASAVPVVAPVTNTKPHSWDLLPARVYPPDSDNNSPGGRSAAYSSHKGPRLGKHFHRNKP